MKIKVTEIEATAEELRASNSVADGILNVLKGLFTPFRSYDPAYECNSEEGEPNE